MDPSDSSHEIHGLFSSIQIRPEDVPEELFLCYAVGGENFCLYKSMEVIPGNCSGSFLFREDVSLSLDGREVCTAALPKGSSEFWFTGKKISVREFLGLSERKLEKL